MKRIICLSIAVCLVFSMLLIGTSCKGSSGTTTEAAETTAAAETTTTTEGIPVPEGKVSIDFWLQDWSGGLKWFGDFVNIFQKKYPNITVSVMAIPFKDLNTKIVTSIAQGTEPALMFVYTDWLMNYDISKMFFPLSPAIYSASEFREKFYTQPLDIINRSSSSKEIYGMPLVTGGNGLGFIIHKDLFDEAGIDPSTIDTWDKLLEAAKKLTVYNGDGTIKRMGIHINTFEAANMVLDLTLQQGAQSKLYNHDTGVFNFNIPEFANAVNILKRFEDEKTFDPKGGDSFTAFPNKLTAMAAHGPWSYGYFSTDYPELNLDFILVPTYPGAKRLHGTLPWSTVVASKKLEGDEKNAALLFINEIMKNPDFYNIPFDGLYWTGIISNKSYVESVVAAVEKGNATVSQKICAIASSNVVPNLMSMGQRIGDTSLANDYILPELQKVFTGEETIEEAQANLSKNVTSVEQAMME